MLVLQWQNSILVHPNAWSLSSSWKSRYNRRKNVKSKQEFKQDEPLKRMNVRICNLFLFFQLEISNASQSVDSTCSVWQISFDIFERPNGPIYNIKLSFGSSAFNTFKNFAPVPIRPQKTLFSTFGSTSRSQNSD